ncbi:unnamed protein product [Euphydryas editha]|uniref:Reverse transcriptase domain-containing protein n=1 Tax=Euphydryas editha TaxID=104508 RepID=A0AAU9UEP4_EUPED|nr:unnamed protein product [Euphydryas editha]
MNIHCERNEIESVKRLGRKSEKPRPITVTFTTMGKKITLLQNKKNMKNSAIYFKEDYPLKVLEKRKQLQTEILKYKAEELTNALKNIKYDVIGLSEVRKFGYGIDEYENFILCYNGQTKGRHGVGFIVKKYLKSCIKSFSGFSDRVALLDIEINNFTISIIQVYAPTEECEVSEIDDFYNTLHKAHQNCSKNVIVMGDFNARVGKTNPLYGNIFGKFGYGFRSSRGQQLIHYAQEYNLSIMNTFFKKNLSRKWTWKSPDQKTTNEIDYILSNFPKRIHDVQVLNNIMFSSDHRMIRSKIALTAVKKSRIKYKPPNYILTNQNHAELFLQKLKNNIEALKISNIYSSQTVYDILEKCILESLKMDKKVEKSKANTILTEETLNLIKQRHQLQILKPKNSEQRRSLSSIYKKTNKNIRKDYNMYRSKIIEKHLIKSRSCKRAYRELRTYASWISSLTENSTSTTSRDNILKIATKFYENLYDQKSTCDHVGPQSFYTQKESTTIVWHEREIAQEIKKLKPEKSPGPDGIPNEAIKLGTTILTPIITMLFNKITEEQRVPEQWTKSNIILLYKKGDPKNIKNYRPISLLPSLYKLFSSCILSRITAKIDENQPVEQAGFRKGYSTVDHIHVLESILEKYKEFQRPLYLAFVDYQKAFDSISHKSIWKALADNKIDQTYCNIIRNIYERSTSRVKLETSGPEIKIKRGVKQGDPLSPKLFIAVLENIFKNLHWKDFGIQIKDTHLSHLRFADDIVLFSESSAELEQMIQSLQLEGEKVGLEMNLEKTKLMTNSTKTPIKIGNVCLDYVDSYIYLGKQVSFHLNNNFEEILRRINISWQKFWAHREILKGELPLSIKKAVMDSGILPCLTYGSQTWIYTKQIKEKIRICQAAMERSILSIRRINKTRNSIIRKRTKLIDFLHHSMKLKWKWAGHLARMHDSRWTKRAVMWEGPKGKRKRGRPSKRWVDDIQAIAGEEWHNRAKNRNLWSQMEEAFTL